MNTFRFLTRFSLVLTFLGLISCWGPTANKWAIKEVTLYCSDPSFNNLDETSHISGDSLFLILQINPAYVFAEAQINSPFTPTVMATSLPEPGGDGIFEDVISIDFTCNKEIGGIPAGESINSIIGLKQFNFDYYSSTEINGISALDYWMILINNKEEGASYFPYAGQTFYIALQDQPTDSIQISTKISTFRQTFESTTKPLLWED